MKRSIFFGLIAIVGALMVILFLGFFCNPAFPAEPGWEVTSSGKLQSEKTYTMEINDKKGNKLFCYIVEETDGGIEAGGDEKNNEIRTLSSVHISNIGERMTPSSSSGFITPLYFYPTMPGYDVFGEKCYKSAMKSKKISMETKEKIKKALKLEEEEKP